jgi:hypothetical protein
MLSKKRFTPLHPPRCQEFGAKDFQPFPAAEFRHSRPIVGLRAQFFKPYKKEVCLYLTVYCMALECFQTINLINSLDKEKDS